MSGFGDFDTALQARETLTRLVIGVLDRERPPYRYGTVISIDPDGRSCMVRFPGGAVDGSNDVQVKIGGITPSSTGQTVRVAGFNGDKFISDVLGRAVLTTTISTDLPVPTGAYLTVAPGTASATWDKMQNPDDSDVNSYEVEFAESADFVTNPRAYTTVAHIFTVPYTPGVHVWARVRSLNGTGGSSAWAAVGNALVPDYPAGGGVTSDGSVPPIGNQPIVTAGLGFLYAQWVPVVNADAVTYEVHVSTTSGFTPTAGTKVGQTDSTSFFVDADGSNTKLVYGTTYFIRIVPKDADGAGPASPQGSGIPQKVQLGDVGNVPYSALTDGLAPTTSPNAPTLAAGVGFIYAKWTAISNADLVSYEVHVSTTNNFIPDANSYVGETNSNFVFIRTQGAGTSYAPLAYGTTYYVKIWAKDLNGYAPNAGTQSSAIPVKAGINDISTVSGTQVKDGSPPASSPAPTVTSGFAELFVNWIAVANNDPVTYEVHLSTSTGFTPSGATKVLETASTMVTIKNLPGTSTPLSYGTTYYVKLVAKDLDGSAAASAEASGTTAQIASADVITVSGAKVKDGSAPASSPTPTIVSGLGALYVYWTAVANADPVTYEVHLSTTTGFTPSGATKVSDETGTYSVIRNLPGGTTPLAYGTTYFVKLVAKDADGSAAAGTQASGTIAQVTNTDITTLSGSKLKDGSAPASSPTPTVVNGIGALYVFWTAVVNADPVTYEVHLSATTGFTPSGATKVSEETGTYSVIKNLPGTTTPLTYGTTYYVKLVAKDLDGSAAASAQASGVPQQTNTADIAASAVTATQILAGTITSTQIQAGGISADRIVANSLTTTQIQAGGIAADRLVANSLTTTQIAAGGIAADRLVANSITTAQIQAGGVNADRLVASSITATQIAAGAVTASKLLVTVGGGNVMPNSSFEVDLSGWGGNVGANWVRSTAQKHGVGVASALFTSPDAAGTPTDIYAERSVSVTNGNWTLSAWVWLTGNGISFGGGNGRDFMIYGAGSPTVIVNYDRTKLNQWQRVVGTVAVAGGVIATRFYAPSGAAIYIDDVQVEEGDVATAYSPKPDEILPGTIVSAMIQAGSIAADRLLANSITTAQIQAGGVNADRLVAGSITATQIQAGTITGDRLAANTVTASKLLVNIGGGNMLANSSFEDGTLTSWAALNSTGVSSNTIHFFPGTWSAKITTTTAGQVYLYTPSPGIPVQAGHTYTMSAYYRPDAASPNRSIVTYLNYYDASGTLTGQFASSGVTEVAGDWVRDKVTGVAPANTNKVLVFASLVGTALNEVHYIDCLQLEEGDVATAYSPKPDEILPGTIVTAMMTANTINGDRIQSNTLSADRIISNSITSASAIFASGAIQTAWIGDGQITTAKIGDLQVNTAKIADGQVTSAKIYDLQADKITAGTLNASISVASGLIYAGTAGGQRTQMDSAGLGGYNSSNVRVVHLSSSVNGTGIPGLGVGSYPGTGAGAYFQMDPTNGLFAGAGSFANAKFKVDMNGNLTVSSGATISAGQFTTAGNPGYFQLVNNYMYAHSGDGSESTAGYMSIISNAGQGQVQIAAPRMGSMGTTYYRMSSRDAAGSYAASHYFYVDDVSQFNITNGSASFSGTVLFGGATTHNGGVITPSIGYNGSPVTFTDAVFMADHQLLFRSSGDGNHYIAYSSQAPDGPVLAGYNGVKFAINNGGFQYKFVMSGSSIYPFTDGGLSNGGTSLRWANVFSTDTYWFPHTGTAASTGTVCKRSTDSYLMVASSNRHHKTNFKKHPLARAHQILDLLHDRVQTFQFKSDIERGFNFYELTEVGMIAEDLHEAGLTELVQYEIPWEIVMHSDDENNPNPGYAVTRATGEPAKPTGIHYDRFGPVLLPIVKENRDTIRLHDARLADLERRLGAAEKKLAAVK